MINIKQKNEVRENQEEIMDPYEMMEKQPALDNEIYAFVPNSFYVTNPLQAQTNAAYTGSTAGGSPITTSQQKSVWYLPVGVYNFSKFIFTMQVQIGDVSSSPPGVGFLAKDFWYAINNFYNPFIFSWEHRTQEGVILYTNNNVDKYNRLSGILNLKLDEGKGTNSVRNFIVPSQRNYLNLSSATYNSTAIPNGTPDPFIYSSVGLINSQFPAETLMDPSVMYFPYTNNSLPNGATIQGDGIMGPPSTGVTAVPTITISFRIGDLLPDSIYNLDKDIYMAKSNIITVGFNPINQIGAMVTLDTSNTAGVLYGITNSIAAGFGGTPGYTIQNMNLITFSQGNQEICERLKMEQNEESIPLVIPYVQVQSYTFNSGTQQIATFKLNTENPITNLYKIYYGLFQPDVGAITCNSSNINEHSWNATRVTLNNTVIRANTNLSSRQDIVEMGEVFQHGSFTSHRALRYSGVYAILFDNEDTKKNYDGELRGVPLGPSNDQILSFTTTCTTAPGGAGPANYQHFIFAVQNRVYYSKKGQIYYVPV